MTHTTRGSAQVSPPCDLITAVLSDLSSPEAVLSSFASIEARLDREQDELTAELRGLPDQAERIWDQQHASPVASSEDRATRWAKHDGALAGLHFRQGELLMEIEHIAKRRRFAKTAREVFAGLSL